MSVRFRVLTEADVKAVLTMDELIDAMASALKSFSAREVEQPVRSIISVDGNRAFVEWWATFDCAADELERWKTYFENDGFAKWLAALRASLAASSPGKAAP